MNEFGIFGKLLRLFHINASEYGGALTGAENMWHAELTGKKALDDLARRYGDDVVYHGSGARVAELEPRQMSWYSEITDMRYPDGDPAVAADAQYDKPMFLALFKGRRRCAYVPIIGGRPAYVVGEALTPEGQDITKLEGYVYVLERKHFTTFNCGIPAGFPGGSEKFGVRLPELRAYAPVKPLAVVKVTVDDFPHPIILDE